MEQGSACPESPRSMNLRGKKKMLVNKKKNTIAIEQKKKTIIIEQKKRLVNKKKYHCHQAKEKNHHR